MRVCEQMGMIFILGQGIYNWLMEAACELLI